MVNVEERRKKHYLINCFVWSRMPQKERVFRQRWYQGVYVLHVHEVINSIQVNISNNGWTDIIMALYQNCQKGRFNVRNGFRSTSTSIISGRAYTSIHSHGILLYAYIHFNMDIKSHKCKTLHLHKWTRPHIECTHAAIHPSTEVCFTTQDENCSDNYLPNLL